MRYCQLEAYGYNKKDSNLLTNKSGAQTGRTKLKSFFAEERTAVEVGGASLVFKPVPNMVMREFCLLPVPTGEAGTELAFPSSRVIFLDLDRKRPLPQHYLSEFPITPEVSTKSF
ncbi:hypothetical protein J6590_061945 [Homalodisca vitripennis]|nr:hypothetical protein J6590_061945 [Homalodisca vitripennis]